MDDTAVVEEGAPVFVSPPKRSHEKKPGVDWAAAADVVESPPPLPTRPLPPLFPLVN